MTTSASAVPSPRCPMCRAEIDRDAQADLCRSCPLHGLTETCRLGLILCPACGYHSLPGETPRGARATASPGAPASRRQGRGQHQSFGRRRARFRHDTPPEAPELPFHLSDLAVGARARVVDFDGLTEADLRRLVAHGLHPGVALRLLQRFPAYVVRVHETEIALESEVADAVLVAPEQPGP